MAARSALDKAHSFGMVAARTDLRSDYTRIMRIIGPLLL